MVVLLLVVVAGAEPAPEGVTVTVAPARPSFVIGEAQWLVLTLHNRGTTPHQASLNPYNGWERGPVAVEVTDPAGRRAPDAFHGPRPSTGTNGGDEVLVSAGGTAELRIDLARYAWLDTPGTYDVRVLFPVDGPIPQPDARWATTRLTLTSPDPAGLEAVVLGHPRAFDDQDLPIRDFYEALGHGRYVPILEALVAVDLPPAQMGRGRWRGSRLDDRALRGLAACPCVAATEALLRLVGHSDAEVRELVGSELLMRIPDRTRKQDAGWFQTRAWDDRLAATAAAVGRTAVATPIGADGWGQDVEFGAEVLARTGSASDGAWVVAALERVRATDVDPRVGNGRHGLLMSLVWSLRAWSDLRSADPDTAALIALSAWDRTRGAPPPDWEATVLRALVSTDPNVVSIALERLPSPPSVAVHAAVAQHLDSRDPWVGVGVRRFVYHHPDPSFREAVLAQIRTATGRELGDWIGVGRNLGIPTERRVEVLVGRISVGGPNDEVVASLLETLTGCRGWTFAPVVDSEVPSLKAAWTRFLVEHRTTLATEGSVTIDPATTDRALVPAGATCILADDARWP